MINNLQSILTQSHSMTSDPVYVVYSKQEIVVDGDCDYDYAVYIRQNRGEYNELDYDAYKDLESKYNEATDYRTIRVDGTGEEVTSEIPKDPFDDEKDFNPYEWEQKFIKLIDRFEQAFFIRENAQRFLDGQRHNLSAPYIYVESAYRNPEWQQIRELLIAAAKKNENSFGELKFGLKYEDIVDGMFVVYSELPFSNYANSLKRIWKTDSGWKEQTLAVEWKGEYIIRLNHEDVFDKHIWGEKRYAPINYDDQTPPVEFMNKVLPLSIKGEQDT